MEWKDVGRIVGQAAPLVGTLLGGPAGGAVGGLVAAALGVDSEPDQVAKAFKRDPEAAIKLQRLQNDHAAEMRRMAIEAETSRLADVNATMRAEYASEDAFVRRARPAFLYVVALSVLVEVLIALVVVLQAPEYIDALASIYAALATPQSIAAGMCGVYLKKRSDDKAVKAGFPPSGGLLGAIFGRGQGGDGGVPAPGVKPVESAPLDR